jgi:hypothetical protein
MEVWTFELHHDEATSRRAKRKLIQKATDHKLARHHSRMMQVEVWYSLVLISRAQATFKGPFLVS